MGAITLQGEATIPSGRMNPIVNFNIKLNFHNQHITWKRNTHNNKVITRWDPCQGTPTSTPKRATKNSKL